MSSPILEGPPRTRLRTEVLWFCGVLLVCVGTGVAGLAWFLAQRMEL